MKKLIALFLLIGIVLFFSGCTQPITNGNNNVGTETGGSDITSSTNGTGTAAPTDLTAENASLYNEVESISSEISSMAVDDVGDALTPITATDLTTE